MTTPDTFPLDPSRADLLHDVAHHVEQTWFARPDGPPAPCLVAVDVDERRVRLARLPLLGDPCAALCGATAPPSWWSIGVVAPAHERPLPPGRPDDPDDPDPAGHRRRPGAAGPPDAASGTPIDLIHLVARTGESVTVRRARGAAGDGSRWMTGSDRAWQGALDDHLRRVLGLRTAPPPPSTLGWWTAQWLDSLLGAAAAGERVGTWAEVAGRHPVIALTARAGAGPAVTAWAVDHLDRAAVLLARRWTWAALRTWAADGGMEVDGVDRRTAGWMDDGLFARTLLAGAAGPPDALAALAALLPAPVFRRVSTTCERWGEASWT
jgi:hypothetical protein